MVNVLKKKKKSFFEERMKTDLFAKALKGNLTCAF